MKCGFDLITSEDGFSTTLKSLENVYILREKEIEKAVFGEINRIATENGFDTYITLNEKAIIDAFQKQIPTKPVKKNPICYSLSIDGEECYAYDYHCPLCHIKLKKIEHHCPCGQALDWSET